LQRRRHPEGYYNLGLAHGVPGVLALLGAACAAGIRKETARPLADGAAAWLLAQEGAAGEGAGFPVWLAPGAPRAPARVAWCYGGLGIAAALLVAARGVGNGEWEREAVRIGLAAAERDPEQAGVRDAGLCHGAAGNAHLFNRMAQATGEPRFARAARFWLARALEMRRPDRGIGGFQAFRSPGAGEPAGWVDEPGVLMGAAGIALALLAATTDVGPAWDRMLLVSARRE
jgi:hypothetical protein